MRTTTATTSLLTPAQHAKKKETSAKSYRENRVQQQINSKLNYYKNTLDADLVHILVEKHGRTQDCCDIIKKSTKRVLKIEVDVNV